MTHWCTTAMPKDTRVPRNTGTCAWLTPRSACSTPSHCNPRTQACPRSVHTHVRGHIQVHVHTRAHAHTHTHPFVCGHACAWCIHMYTHRHVVPYIFTRPQTHVYMQHTCKHVWPSQPRALTFSHRSSGLGSSLFLPKPSGLGLDCGSWVGVLMSALT